ncbi:MAG TPA: DUF6412 domain-containing protein [Streptosporangiaceae bacterium]|jgi:hypothetical protein
MALANRVLTALGSVLIVTAGLWWSAGHLLLAPFGLSALAVTALAGAALVGTLTVCLASGARLVAITAAVPQLSHAVALRDKSWGAAYLPQRDPDAAGRPRPRAPSAAPAAALS